MTPDVGRISNGVWIPPEALPKCINCKRREAITAGFCRECAAVAPKCDVCDAPTLMVDGKPQYPVSHGSTVGFCYWCAKESISL